MMDDLFTSIDAWLSISTTHHPVHAKLFRLWILRKYREYHQHLGWHWDRWHNNDEYLELVAIEHELFGASGLLRSPHEREG